MAWDYFDRIYCITLHGRPERRRSAENAFRHLCLLDRVIFHAAHRHSVDPEQGIFESHQACIREGLAAGASRIAVFEDDVVIERYSPERLNSAIDYLRSGREWELLIFGGLVSRSWHTGNPSVLKVKYRSLAHAYAVNQRLGQRISDMTWQRLPYDVMLQRLAPTTYMVYPSFAFQSDAATDNQRLKNLDRWRRVCGGLKRIQKTNEWYHRYRWPIVIGHVVAVALLLSWMLN